MNDKELIEDLLLRFCSAIQGADDEYRRYFEEDAKSGYFHDGYKDAVRALLSDKAFDWKELFRQQKFYQYDEQKTGEELLLGFKVFTWDLLFPEQLLPAPEKSILQDWLLTNLPAHEWMSFDTIIQNLKKITSGNWQNLDYYNLLFYYTYEGRYYLKMNHEVGTSQWLFQKKAKGEEGFDAFVMGEEWDKKHYRRIGSIRIPDSRLDFPELSKLIRNELSYESGLSRAEIIASIASSSHYNFKRIRTEFEQINNYDEMTLVSLAVNNKMIKTAPSYTNADVRYELQDYLWDFIYPEDKIMPEECETLGREAEKLVCKAPNWMEASYLFQMVAPVIHHPVYYNLAFLEQPLSNNKIELKKNTKIDADGYYRFSYFVRKVMD